MGVHVHDTGEVADDEFDPGIAPKVEGKGRHLRHLQDLPHPIRAAGDDPALVLDDRNALLFEAAVVSDPAKSWAFCGHLKEASEVHYYRFDASEAERASSGRGTS